MEIRSQVPLPETADELCAVAGDLGVGGEEIRIGRRATEAEVKRPSAAGELSKYRMIHFAAHGALAGQGAAWNLSGRTINEAVMSSRCCRVLHCRCRCATYVDR